MNQPLMARTLGIAPIGSEKAARALIAWTPKA